MNSEELAKVLLENKPELVYMINPYVHKFIYTYPDKDNLFKESVYIKDLKDFVKKQLLDKTIKIINYTASYEELSILFEDNNIDNIIRKQYMREFLYN